MLPAASAGRSGSWPPSRGICGRPVLLASSLLGSSSGMLFGEPRVTQVESGAMQWIALLVLHMRYTPCSTLHDPTLPRSGTLYCKAELFRGPVVEVLHPCHSQPFFVLSRADWRRDQRLRTTCFSIPPWERRRDWHCQLRSRSFSFPRHFCQASLAV